MPAVRRTRFMEIIWKLHRYVYRVSGGRVGKAFGGAPVLLLITTGRRTGESRPVTLTYFEDGDRFVVIGSNAGEDRHPAWWLNLRAHPDATVQIGQTTTRVRAVEAVGEERERLWAEIIRRDPGYEEYRLRTDRQIPVVLLEPTDASSLSGA
ncbi:MAG: nitroreductase family deazaflavin-dependent oxidoreductase [Actinomycetota bacterium]|nr:nitroreductase family deazaflavin-dependent oxidoreductase [Actinomycetota bacterium]